MKTLRITLENKSVLEIVDSNGQVTINGHYCQNINVNISGAGVPGLIGPEIQIDINEAVDREVREAFDACRK